MTDTPHVHEARELLNRVKTTYTDTIEFVTRLLPALQQGSLKPGDICDVGYFCREMENVLDEARKELKAKRDLCGKILCMQMIKDGVNDTSAEQVTRGKYATGTPDVQQRPHIPSRNTPEYFELLSFLGVPEEYQQAGVLSISFSQMSDMLTRLAEQGKNPPKGLVRTYSEFQTTFRARTVKKKANSQESNEDGIET